MHKKTSWFSTLVVALVLLGAALTQVEAGPSKTRVTAKEVEKNTKKVMTQLPWAKNLSEAKELAKKQNKLVFYIQIVGELDGGL